MARTLLHSLCAAGIALRADGDRLIWKAQEGRMTPALLGSIKAKKQGLLDLVRDLPAEIHPLLNDINLGEALDVLKQIPDNSIDLIVTDPPYGYGFMGKQWDKALPDPRIWAECLRVLKPGGFVFVMASPRQDVLSRMIIALEDAGFETGFTSLYWTYAAGFPKAHNIGKAVEKKLGVKRMDGSYAGFQPKPAVEVILVVMKRLDRKGFTDQALHSGKGVTWLDDCRIPYGDEVPSVGNRHRHDRGDGYGFKPQWKIQGGVKWTPEKEWKQGIERKAHENGRFPANLLVSDGVLDDGEIKKSPKPYQKKHAGFRTKYVGGEEKTPKLQTKEYGDSGTYSRFFSLDAWADLNLHGLPEAIQRSLPYLIVPKASPNEKNAGLDSQAEDALGRKGHGLDRICEHCGAPQLKPHLCNCEKKSWVLPKKKNTHPTVKPIQLMAYLITMGSREGDIVLDPFAGSGTTLIAAHMLNRRFVGIEREAEYYRIATKRITHFTDTQIKEDQNEEAGKPDIRKEG